ncbi:MAG: hypothetical protein R3E01_36120 [Pirellulaceae bacterium]
MTQATTNAKRNPETNENEPQASVIAFPSSAEGRSVLDEVVRRGAKQLEFRSNNVLHRPVVDAIELIKQHRDGKQRHFAVDEAVPIDGVVKPKFREFVIERGASGNERVNRINYEIAVLQALRERLHLWLPHENCN